MKKNISLRLIFVIAIVVSATIIVLGGGVDSKKPLETVDSVDLKRYAGKWFEVARLPNKFEKQCVGNVTAEYVLQKNDKIQVTNKCDEANGKKTVARGEARIQDKQTNAKLEVRFAPKFLSFIPAVWGDYWIIALDAENYQYALVGDQSRNYLWFLSRTPQINQAKYEELTKIAADKGFETTKIIPVKND
ncbi:MAG: lipocalin family protein [Pyrinomonadaceae bacterium]